MRIDREMERERERCEEAEERSRLFRELKGFYEVSLCQVLSYVIVHSILPSLLITPSNFLL